MEDQKLDRLKAILNDSIIQPTEDLKKNCSIFVSIEEHVHIESRSMEPFETIPGLYFGISEQGRVVGKPIYEHQKQGFDIRSSVLLTYENVKHFAEMFDHLIFASVNGKEAFENLRRNQCHMDKYMAPLYIIKPNYNGYRFAAQLQFTQEGIPYLEFSTQFNPLYMDPSRPRNNSIYRQPMNPRTAKWKSLPFEKRFGFQLTNDDSYVEFLQKIDLNYLGLCYEDARVIQGMLDILEKLCEVSSEDYQEDNIAPILSYLQIVTDVADQVKKNDSYKNENIKEALKHLQKSLKVPYKNVETIYCQRKIILGDLLLIRFYAKFFPLANEALKNTRESLQNRDQGNSEFSQDEENPTDTRETSPSPDEASTSGSMSICDNQKGKRKTRSNLEDEDFEGLGYTQNPSSDCEILEIDEERPKKEVKTTKNVKKRKIL